MSTMVLRDVMLHVELATGGGPGGAVCVSIEEEDGQFGLPLVLELGPFDTGLDVAMWLARRLFDAGVLRKS